MRLGPWYWWMCSDPPSLACASATHCPTSDTAHTTSVALQQQRVGGRWGASACACVYVQEWGGGAWQYSCHQSCACAPASAPQQGETVPKHALCCSCLACRRERQPGGTEPSTLACVKSLPITIRVGCSQTQRKGARHARFALGPRESAKKEGLAHLVLMRPFSSRCTPAGRGGAGLARMRPSTSTVCASRDCGVVGMWVGGRVGGCVLFGRVGKWRYIRAYWEGQGW